MTKHNQTKSLGPLTNFQSAPEPTPETTDERIHRLERRILQVETLLNDVMQQLDKPYRDQSLFDGKPHGNGKPNPVNPKQAKPQQAKPKAEQAKKAQTPPVPPATEEQTQAHAEAIIAFLSPYPEKLWHGAKLRKAIQELCDINKQQVDGTLRHFRKTGHLVIINDVEVDGDILKGAYKFIPNPEPKRTKPKQVQPAKSSTAPKPKDTKIPKEVQEQITAKEKADKAAAAELVATSFQQLQDLLANGDSITSTELQAMGISLKRQGKIRKTDAYQKSRILCKKPDGENYEYSIESTD